MNHVEIYVMNKTVEQLENNSVRHTIALDFAYKLNPHDKHTSIECNGWEMELIQTDSAQAVETFLKSGKYKALNEDFVYSELDMVDEKGFAGFFSEEQTRDIAFRVMEQLKLQTHAYVLC